MLVEDIGENHLIEILTDVLRNHPDDGAGFDPSVGMRVGIGDDAAVWDSVAATTALTTDALVDGVHFDSASSAWRDVGWKAMAASMSDVAAMGCTPSYSTVTLGLRGDLSVESLKDLYRGMRDACRVYGGVIVGGDTVRSSVVFISVTMLGTRQSTLGMEHKPQKIMTRDSAKPGDKIGVTGYLGCATGGLRHIFELRDGSDHRLDEAISTHLNVAQNLPSPRVEEGVKLVEMGVRAAMDLSDGLVEDLGKLCRASGVGAQVELDSVPVDRFLKAAFPREWLHLALFGGEDYEILLTAPKVVMDKVSLELPGLVTVVGNVVNEPVAVNFIDPNGNVVEVGSRGWGHFYKSDN